MAPAQSGRSASREPRNSWPARRVVAGAPIDVVVDALRAARSRGGSEVVAVVVAGVRVPCSAARDELVEGA